MDVVMDYEGTEGVLECFAYDATLGDLRTAAAGVLCVKETAAVTLAVGVEEVFGADAVLLADVEGVSERVAAGAALPVTIGLAPCEEARRRLHAMYGEEEYDTDALTQMAVAGDAAKLALVMTSGLASLAMVGVALKGLACAGMAWALGCLLECGASPDAVDEFGWPPLARAASCGKARVCEVLLAHGADVEYRLPQDQETALFAAAEGGFTDVCKLLMAHGADVAYLDVCGQTALFSAAANGHAATCRYLVAEGADVARPDDEQTTALHIAAELHHAAACKALIKLGAAVNVRDHAGNTPLDNALLSRKLAAADEPPVADGAVYRLLRKAGAATGEELDNPRAAATANCSIM